MEVRGYKTSTNTIKPCINANLNHKARPITDHGTATRGGGGWMIIQGWRLEVSSKHT